MRVQFYAPDGPIVRHALALYARAVEKAAKADQEVNIDTTVHLTRLGESTTVAETLRVAKHDSEDGATLAGDIELTIEQCDILRVGCYHVLKDLAKIEEAKPLEALDVDRHDIVSKSDDVRHLVQRLGGQCDAFGPDAGRRKTPKGEAAQAEARGQQPIDFTDQAAADTVAAEGAAGRAPGTALTRVRDAAPGDDRAEDIVDADFEIITDASRQLPAGDPGDHLDDVLGADDAPAAADAPAGPYTTERHEGLGVWFVLRDGEQSEEHPHAFDDQATAAAAVAELNAAAREALALDALDEAPLANEDADEDADEDVGADAWDQGPQAHRVASVDGTGLPPLPWSEDDDAVVAVAGAELTKGGAPAPAAPHRAGAPKRPRNRKATN